MSSSAGLRQAIDPYLLQRIQPDHIDSTPPTKRINSGEDLAIFLSSTAYRDLKIWISQLSRACLPRRAQDGKIEIHELGETEQYSPAITAIRDLLNAFAALLAEAPPDTGPRRFGNVAFRQWVALLCDRIDTLLEQHLANVIEVSRHSFLAELKAYLLESFGSAQRLDYGTGHELNYLAFLGGLWKLGIFTSDEQWKIVAGAVNP